MMIQKIFQKMKISKYVIKNIMFLMREASSKKDCLCICHTSITFHRNNPPGFELSPIFRHEVNLTCEGHFVTENVTRG